MTPARRPLAFDSLDDLVRDAEHLSAVGYDKAGKWDLAQACGHLSEWFRYQIDGFPKAPLLIRPMLWLVRNTFGPAAGRRAFAAGNMRPGIPTVPQSVPASGGDAGAAVAKLREAVARWQAYTGPLHPSPMFGTMTKDEWRRGHLIHAAHHLSFLIPKA
jgi:hypothetical protein